MPDLANLKSGSRVFVDTMIFDFHFRGKSATCTAFFNRIKAGDVEAYVDTHVLTELMHALMVGDALKKGLITKWGALQLKRHLNAHPADAVKLTDYYNQFLSVLQLGVRRLQITEKLMKDTKPYRDTYALLVTDSFHYGCMCRKNIALSDLVTHDNDFKNVTGLTIWEPLDVI